MTELVALVEKFTVPLPVRLLPLRLPLLLPLKRMLLVVPLGETMPFVSVTLLTPNVPALSVSVPLPRALLLPTMSVPAFRLVPPL